MKLPEAFIKPPDPELKNMEIGQTVYVAAAYMQVDETLECSLLSGAPFESENSVFHLLRVRRDVDGFHVTLLAPYQWTPGERSKTASRIPIASFVADYDTTLMKKFGK